MKWTTHQAMALMASFAAGLPLAGMAAAWFGSVAPDMLDQHAARRAFFRQKKFNQVHRRSSHWFGWWLAIWAWSLTGQLGPLPDALVGGFGFGALLEMGGFSYYVAGDTDVLADVACDVLFVPCDGLYNMLHYMDQVPDQLAAMDHKPGVVVPYHYAGYMEGTDSNGPHLAEKLKEMGFSVRLLCRP